MRERKERARGIRRIEGISMVVCRVPSVSRFPPKRSPLCDIVIAPPSLRFATGRRPLSRPRHRPRTRYRIFSTAELRVSRYSIDSIIDLSPYRTPRRLRRLTGSATSAPSMTICFLAATSSLLARLTDRHGRNRPKATRKGYIKPGHPDSPPTPGDEKRA